MVRVPSLLIPIALLFLAVALVGCSGKAAPQTVEVTRVVEVASEPQSVEVTRIVEVTVEPQQETVERAVTQIVEVEVTREVEVTSVVEVVREVTVILEPSPPPGTIVTAAPEPGTREPKPTARPEVDATDTPANEFGQIVTARDVREDGSPIDPTDTFSATDQSIWVVIEAERISTGTTLFARWSRNGSPFEDSSVITAEQDYENIWVNFSLKRNASGFQAGDHSVTIFADGAAVGEAAFTVE